MTDCVQDLPPLAEVVDGEPANTEQPQAVTPSPALDPVQGLSAANPAPILQDSVQQTPAQGATVAEPENGLALLANGGATEGNQACLLYISHSTQVHEIYLLIIPFFFFVADEEMEDQVPLSKLVVMKKEDATHLQLVARASEINRTLGMLIEAYGFLDDDTSFGLDLTEDPHDVRATLMDLRKLLEEVPFDRRKVLRNVNQALVYWATVYEEPRPDDLEQLMTHLRKLKQGLEGKTPFPTDTNSSTEAGRRSGAWDRGWQRRPNQRGGFQGKVASRTREGQRPQSNFAGGSSA